MVDSACWAPSDPFLAVSRPLPTFLNVCKFRRQTPGAPRGWESVDRSHRSRQVFFPAIGGLIQAFSCRAGPSHAFLLAQPVSTGHTLPCSLFALPSCLPAIFAGYLPCVTPVHSRCRYLRPASVSGLLALISPPRSASGPLAQRSCCGSLPRGLP
jgi:hypothetical protein